jgi:hypothetical protein
MTHRAALLLCLSIAMSAAAGCGGADVERGQTEEERLAPLNLYPLREGHVWSYNVDTGTDLPTLTITRVVAHIGSRVEVSSGGDAVVYELRPDGIFRPMSETWLLKAPVREGATWPSAQGMVARVASTTESVETPSGSYTDCVRVEEQGGEADRLVNTVYCPGIGPVLVASRMQLTLTEEPVEVTARLLGYAFDAE